MKMSKRDDQVRQVGTHTNEYNKVKTGSWLIALDYYFHCFWVQTNNSTAPLFKCYATCPVFHHQSLLLLFQFVW